MKYTLPESNAPCVSTTQYCSWKKFSIRVIKHTKNDFHITSTTASNFKQGEISCIFWEVQPFKAETSPDSRYVPWLFTKWIKCFQKAFFPEVGKVDVWSNINFDQFGRIKTLSWSVFIKVLLSLSLFIKLDPYPLYQYQLWSLNHLISLSVFSRCVVSVVLTKQSKPFAFVKIGSDAKRLQHSCKLFYFLSELCFVAW